MQTWGVINFFVNAQAQTQVGPTDVSSASLSSGQRSTISFNIQPNQRIIGIYGYQASDNSLRSFGLKLANEEHVVVLTEYQNQVDSDFNRKT